MDSIELYRKGENVKYSAESFVLSAFLCIFAASYEKCKLKTTDKQ